MSKQTPQQQFETELRKELEAIVFPEDKVPDNFFACLDIAMENESKPSISCDLPTYMRLSSKIDSGIPFDMYTMGYAINAIEKQTPAVFRNTDFDYYKMIIDVTRMGEEWNEIVMPVRDKIMRKMQALQNMGGQMKKAK